ncbi:HAD family hydrolase [Candidatus Nitrospira allomarina]|uniref:HAD family hydrolase n=1 Tax=Candidatus Nitrospira allomarina TaxID=3020900 RepID=A0AA96GAJ0_9BACT|nr:HAD family hydrolase [Candidatus Nitrospira allomarina]WNM56390.1 HAD family hydrolase [Candidatus Nitrospira allomarina]
MIQAVIFDVDGTPMDTNYLHVEAWARAFSVVKHPVPRAAIHRQIGKGSDLMLGALLTDEALHERANELHSQFFDELKDHTYPLPGAKEILATLSSQDIAIWLATSAKSEELEHHVQALGAKDKLAGLVSSADVESAKPAPDIFQLTLERAGCSPKESIVIGDTIWDIQSAQGCGLQTIAVRTGGAFSREELHAAGAVAVYQDCAELLASGFPTNFEAR